MKQNEASINHETALSNSICSVLVSSIHGLLLHRATVAQEWFSNLQNFNARVKQQNLTEANICINVYEYFAYH